MKQVIRVFLCIVMIGVFVPSYQVNAFSKESFGSITSGEEYSGVMEKNEVGNSIPVRYELSLKQDSMIRIQLFTQEDSDSCLSINSVDSPNESDAGYGSFPGSDLTLINDGSSSSPAPYVFSTSSYGFTAYKGNSAEYTELFGSLAAGDYYIVLTGDSYDFIFNIEPLLYQGDNTNPNASLETAASYMVGDEQQGILIANGIINQNFNDYGKMQNSWYKFTADAGSYRLAFQTDGFLQGYCTVVNAPGYPINGNSIKAEAYYKFSNDEELAASYEEHLEKAGTRTVDFTLPEKGTYYININRRMWTSGSYQFKITAIQDVSKIDAAKDTIKLKVGDTAINKITAYYTDGITKNVTGKASYTASASSLKVSKNGEMKATKRGVYKITAVYNGKKTTFKVIVR